MNRSLKGDSLMWKSKSNVTLIESKANGEGYHEFVIQPCVVVSQMWFAATASGHRNKSKYARKCNDEA